ncbi:hypothetical protein DFS34DRAFT_26476 [Phlyctochytrium arcticum]|nr:hypothetical protein DFS34DRAFT_26476 [Phlyctochytrium arcticum]
MADSQEVPTKSNSDAESATLEKFLEYQWNNDQRFQQGLSSILAKYAHTPLSEDEKLAQENAVEKAKCFYFDKFVSPFTYAQLQRWKESKPTIPDTSQPPSSHQSTPAVPLETASTTDTSSSSETQPRYPSSFQELCEMVARGEEVPGIKEIPDKLNEQKPSESKMAPKKKPWEVQKGS